MACLNEPRLKEVNVLFIVHAFTYMQCYLMLHIQQLMEIPSQQHDIGLSSAQHIIHSGPIWVANSGCQADMHLGNWSAGFTLRNNGPLPGG